jgi:DNA repair exonuclease SbcCD ATPase subunit
MLGSYTPPTANDLSGAISILNIINNPKEAQALLTQINESTEQLKQQREALSKVQVDIQNQQQDLKSKRDSLTQDYIQQTHLNNMLIKTKDDLDRRESGLNHREVDINNREITVTKTEDKHKQFHNQLNQREQDLMSKRQQLDFASNKVAETQKALDSRIEKINSVLST